MMKTFSKQRAKAAKWMYERKDRPVEWWRWGVLTKRKEDPESLGFDNKTAFLIFADLVHDGLLVPTVGSDGREALAINPGKDADWRRMMSPWRYWFADKVWLIFFWLLSAVASAVVGFLVGQWFA